MYYYNALSDCEYDVRCQKMQYYGYHRNPFFYSLLLLLLLHVCIISMSCMMAYARNDIVIKIFELIHSFQFIYCIPLLALIESFCLFRCFWLCLQYFLYFGVEFNFLGLNGTNWRIDSPTQNLVTFERALNNFFMEINCRFAWILKFWWTVVSLLINISSFFFEIS